MESSQALSLVTLDQLMAYLGTFDILLGLVTFGAHLVSFKEQNHMAGSLIYFYLFFCLNFILHLVIYDLLQASVLQIHDNTCRNFGTCRENVPTGCGNALLLLL